MKELPSSTLSSWIPICSLIIIVFSFYRTSKTILVFGVQLSSAFSNGSLDFWSYSHCLPHLILWDPIVAPLTGLLDLFLAVQILVPISLLENPSWFFLTAWKACAVPAAGPALPAGPFFTEPLPSYPALLTCQPVSLLGHFICWI